MDSKEKNFYESVIFLNCGGTIDMDSKRTAEQSSVKNLMPNIEKLLNEKSIKIIYDNVFEKSIDSTNIGQNEWDIIFTKIKKVYHRKLEFYKTLSSHQEYPFDIKVGGIVISHGTDTMQLTSFIVAMRVSLIDLFFPIIFTGSFTTVDDKDNDVVNNLTKSAFLSQESQTPKNVFVFIGDELHLATRTTKVYSTKNTEGKYFFSYPFPIAKVKCSPSLDSKAFEKYLKISEEKEEILRKPKRSEEEKKVLKKPFIDEFSLRIDNDYYDFLVSSNLKNKWQYIGNIIFENENWPVVEHIVLGFDSSKEIIFDFLHRLNKYRKSGVKKIGLIIQGNFSNSKDFINISTSIRNIVDNEGVFVAVGSKEVYEKLIKSDFQTKNLCCLPKSLSYTKARTKLLWLLRLNIKNEYVSFLMNENINGENANVDKFPDWIQYENYNKDGEIVYIYPNIDVSVFEDAITRAKKSNSRVYIYGFGYGHLPTISTAISEAVNNYLQNTFNAGFSLPASNDLEDILNRLTMIIHENKDMFDKYYESNLTIKRILGGDYEVGLAKRVVKYSLMDANKTLEIIGNATENGVRFISKATTLGQTDLTQYPVGLSLHCVGVMSDKTKQFI